MQVEKLKAAEDQLLDVIVALARHSPAASEAVMKCPRLVDAIIQRFILVKEDRDDGVHFAQPSRTKAIELLKVELNSCRMALESFHLGAPIGASACLFTCYSHSMTV